MKKKKYLPLYYEWLKTEVLPGGSGLCCALDIAGIDPGEVDRYISSGSDAEWFHWCEHEDGQFDPVRQNMLLLLAAIHNEL